MRWENGRRSENIGNRRGMRGGNTGPVGGGIGAPLLALGAMYFGGEPSVALSDTEDVWGALFRGSVRAYEKPVLVLYSGAVRSACGFAEAAMDPPHCDTFKGARL